jgi:hypothetical protein
MIRCIIISLLLLLVSSAKLAAQTTIYFGGGVEFNNIDLRITWPEGTGLLHERYATAKFNFGIEKQLVRDFALNMEINYTNNEVVYSFPGITPLTETFGFHKFSVRPSVSKYWFDNIKSSVGLDVSVLTGHYRRINYGKVREEFWLNGVNGPHLNTQLGPYVSLGYRWKQFLVQADAVFGLTYLDNAVYRNYIDVANYYGLSVLYGLEVGKKKRK